MWIAEVNFVSRARLLIMCIFIGCRGACTRRSQLCTRKAQKKLGIRKSGIYLESFCSYEEHECGQKLQYDKQFKIKARQYFVNIIKYFLKLIFKFGLRVTPCLNASNLRTAGAKFRWGLMTNVTLLQDSSKTERIIRWNMTLNWADEDQCGCDLGIEVSQNQAGRHGGG